MEETLKVRALLIRTPGLLSQLGTYWLCDTHDLFTFLHAQHTQLSTLSSQSCVEDQMK